MKSVYKIKNSETIKSLKLFNDECIACNQCSCLMMEDLGIEMKSFSYKLLNDSFNKKEVFSCVECNQCNAKCPKDLDVHGLFVNAKADVCNQTENSFINTPYFSQQFVKTKHSIKKPSSNIVFMSGCSFKKHPELIDKTLSILKDYDNNITYYDGCCTKPVKLLGKKDLHEKYLKEYEEVFKDTTIITACFSCTRVLEDHVSVINLYDYLLQNDLIDSKNIEFNCGVKLPCHLNNERIDLCKSVIDKININVSNYESLCCGSGGLIGFTNNKLSKKYQNESLNNYENDNVISFCVECSRKLKKDKNVKHILEFI